MEKYKEQLKKRKTFNIMGIALILAIYSIVNFGVPESWLSAGNLAEFIKGFQAGLGIVFIVLSIMEIVNINKALKYDEKLNEMYIEATDERKKKIQTEVNAATSSIFLLILMLCTIFAGYFNSIVFFTLLGTLIVFASVKAVCKGFFNKKY